MEANALPDQERPEPADSRLARNFVIIAIALLLLKLLLVSQREIVPEQHDAEAYATASLYDLRLIFFDSAGHPPGAALVMSLARSLGIPYRIFIEVCLGVAAFLLLRPLVIWTRLGIAAVAVLYALLLFHPTLILEMDRAMSDPVCFAFWLAGVGGIIGFVAAPRDKLPWWNLGLAIVSFAFVGITRSGEGAIILVEMITVALLSILLFRGVDGWRHRRAVVACFCAVVANLLAAQALSAAHYLKDGYWGASAVESREWWRLYSTLLSLPVQRNDRAVLANKATMDMAESFSQDLRSMSACLRLRQAQFPGEELPNYEAPWAVTACLPVEDSFRQYTTMRTISADVLNGARERHLPLLAPILGIIPQPATQWLPALPSSIVGVARDAVRIPGSTHVAQDSWKAELFDRALLRRTALVATGENPEIFGYKLFVRPLYRVLGALFWPSIPIILFIVAAVVIRSSITTTSTKLIAFALSVLVIDVLCRISFYSMVDWILWELPPRYLLGPNVLAVVIVSSLLTVWLAPGARLTLGPKLARFPALWSWAENGGHPSRRT